MTNNETAGTATIAYDSISKRKKSTINAKERKQWLTQLDLTAKRIDESLQTVA
jgi:hypothetical protein